MELTRNRSLAPNQFELFDDFLAYTDTQLWTKTDGDAGASVAVDGDGVGGLLTLTTGATDNNEAYIETTNELFKIVAGKEIELEARLTFTEANTDDANVAFGVIDAPGANTLVDDGAGLKTTASGAAIFKVDGGTVWKTFSSKSTTQTITTSKTTAGGAYQTLKILIRPRDLVTADVTFFVDGAQLQDTNSSAGQPDISHSITYSSATEMAVFCGVKAGGANSEVVNLDYIRVTAVR